MQKSTFKEQILLGQNIVLTILTIAGFTAGYFYKPLLYEMGFPGDATLLVFMASAVVTLIAVVVIDDPTTHARWRLIAYCSHLVVIMCLYAVLGGTWRGAGLLAALILVVVELFLVPFPKDHGDPLTDRGLRTAILSLLFGIAGYAAVMVITSAL